jgi:protein-tyrosine-phosphatase
MRGTTICKTLTSIFHFNEGYRHQDQLMSSEANVPTYREPSMSRKVRILFVCVENSNRSQMAQAFAQMYGREHVEAFSAGSRPSGQINPKAIAAMAELGYDLTQHQSKSIELYNDQPVDVAVTMGCGDACPRVRARLRYEWQVPDPRDLPPEEFRQVRDLIAQKVRALLQDLGVPLSDQSSVSSSSTQL